MTDCHRADVRDLLPDWVNGSLTGDAAEDVAEHLTTCIACGEEADLLRRLRAALSVEPVIDVRRVAATVAARTSRGVRREVQRKSWLVVAGGLAVAASVAFGALFIERSRERVHVTEPRVAEAELPVAGGLSDLREDQLEALLVRLADIEALPETSTMPALTTTVTVQ